MRFLHTADWHLGRVFHGVHLTDDQAHLLDQLVGLIADADLDAVLVAGDVYDRAMPPPDAVALLDDFLSRVAGDLRVPVYIIAGNHDSPERLGFGARLLKGGCVHLRTMVGTSTALLEDRHGLVSLLMVPYAEPAAVRQALGEPDIRSHDEAAAVMLAHAGSGGQVADRQLLMAHLTVRGGFGSESERPLAFAKDAAVDGGRFAGFHYAALGHLHRPQRIGRGPVRYSGSLFCYSFAEVSDVKSVNLVEMDGGGGVKVEAVPLAPRRAVRHMTGTLGDLLRRAEAEGGREDYVKVTLREEWPRSDVMGRLRAVYPNLLQLERKPTVGTSAGEVEPPRGGLKEPELFAQFYQQTTGQGLTEEQSLLVREVWEQVEREQREGPCVR